MTRQLIDLIGKKFGLLTILKIAGKNKHKRILWLCHCNCGKEKIIAGSDIKSGRTQSCGCEQKRLTSNSNTKHGHYRNNQPSKTYNSWHSMIQRCTNPKHTRWMYYGGRGITVCNSWRKFKNFLRDMGERPVGKSIDRINNDGNYCQSNCRWATQSQQQNNTSRSRVN